VRRFVQCTPRDEASAASRHQAPHQDPQSKQNAEHDSDDASNTRRQRAAAVLALACSNQNFLPAVRTLLGIGHDPLFLAAGRGRPRWLTSYRRTRHTRCCHNTPPQQGSAPPAMRLSPFLIPSLRRTTRFPSCPQPRPGDKTREGEPRDFRGGGVPTCSRPGSPLGRRSFGLSFGRWSGDGERSID